MKVWLTAQVAQAMRQHARKLCPLETGGILLGWRSGEDRVVVDMRGPGLRALHGRQCFLPDHTWQLDEIHRAFKESNGDIDYLGDWHSHPNGTAAMSQQDSITLRRITRRVKEPLMLIIAGTLDNLEWAAGCWRGIRQSGVMWRRFEVAPQELKLFEPPTNWPKPYLSLH